MITRFGKKRPKGKVIYREESIVTQEHDELNEIFVPDRPVEPPPHPHPNPPVPRPNPIPPGRFSLTFDGFFAFDTRALENDTLWLITAFSTLNSNINPTSASQVKFLGDFHGNDLFNEINFAPFSQPAEVNPGTYGAPLKFGHALLNFGHAQDPAEYINFNAGRVLLEAVTSFDPVGGAPSLESINSDINAALNHTFADCDGCVAFHVFALSWEELVQGTQTIDPFKLSSDEPGFPSPWQCGAESHYHVYWSIRRV
jgi:hypothetical protein